jgi:hypothetical protein
MRPSPPPRAFEAADIAVASPARNRNSGDATPPMNNSVKYVREFLSVAAVQESVMCASTMARTAMPRSQSRCGSRAAELPVMTLRVEPRTTS